MDWVKVAGLVITPEGGVSQIENVTEDNGIKLTNNKWYCRTELQPVTKENVVKLLNGVLPPEPHPSTKLENVKTNFYVFKGEVFVCWKSSLQMTKVICSVSDYEAEAVKYLHKEKQMTNWYDYNNQEMVSLPPVGEIVITNAGEETFKVKILEHTFNGVSNIAVCRVINDNINPNLGKLGYYQHFYPLDWNRNEGKNKLIDKAVQIMYDNACATKGELINGVKRLYELGYLKFPEDK